MAGALDLHRPVYQAGDLPVSEEDREYAMTRELCASYTAQSHQGGQWRRDSARAVEYWDGNHFDSEMARRLRAAELPMIPHGLLKRWIGGVMGTLERNQTDGLVKMDSDEHEALGLALAVELKEAERMTKADRAILDAQGCMMKGGIGWVEVGDPPDPFGYPDRVEMMPWSEVQFDQTGVGYDLLEKCDWFRRAQQMRRKDVLRAFPHAANIIETAGTSSDLSTWWEPERLDRDQWGIRDISHWWDRSYLDVVCVVEWRYRVWCNGWMVQTPAGAMQFDPDNPQHMAAYQAGAARPERCKYPRYRQAYWLGPYCLADRWNPVPANEVGWVPFVCYREERTGAIYGLVRDMIPLLDEINSSKAKLLRALTSKGVIFDEGRVVDEDNLREDLNRKDFIIKLDPARPNGKFEIVRHEQDIQGWMLMFNDAVQKLGYIHGMDAAFTGTPEARDQSGIAMQTQADQALTCMGTPFNRAKEARQRVLKLLLDRRIARMTGQLQLPYTDKAGSKKKLPINTPMQQPDGSMSMIDPQAIKRHVVLEETPSTPTYRSQTLLSVTNMMRSMTPEVQSLFAPLVLRLSDGIPDKQKYVDFLEKKIGMGGEPQNEQEAQAAALEQQKAEEQDALMMRSAEAKAALDEARAAQAQSQAQATMEGLQKMIQEIQNLAVQVSLTQAQTEKTLMEIEVMKANIINQAQQSAREDQQAAQGEQQPGTQW